MFERFTAEARAVVVRAQEEAREFRHGQIGTEHVLLGLLAMPTSVAAQVLRKLGVSSSSVRDAVVAAAGTGEHAPPGHIPFTPRAKKVLELSLREAQQLKHNYIGTEHILLALQREGEGLAARILADQVRDLGAVRAAVQETLDARLEQSVGDAPARTSAADEVVNAARALAGDAPMGSHHLLEALVRAEGSMAAKVLGDLGIDAAAIASKVDAFDAEDTTDATPEELAARKMELRLSGDEVHLVFRDQATVDLAKSVTDLVGGPVTPAGPITGKFVPLWTATNGFLISLSQSLRDEPLPDDADRGKAALLVRRVLHDRLRRRDR